jgi:stage II sporulation protein P
MERKAIRWGLAVIACAALLRLAGPAADFFTRPEVAAAMVYLGTGRVVKLQTQPQVSAPTETQAATEPAPVQPQVHFETEDAELVEVIAMCDYPLDLEAMLLSELQWDLTGDSPTVLILHSHATESFAYTAGYEESSPYRTLDTHYNMVRVGTELKNALEAKGIGVLHDTSLHDYPSYTDSYISSREAAQWYLQEYPTISLILDLHRDASDMSQATQLRTATTVDGVSTARLMMVVGTNASGRYHPNWQENMALATKLHVYLEKTYPGLCRPISFRTERFNQDLSTGALLVEVGAAGDSLEEALAAARLLAEGIGELAKGY